jgi:sporulation protein YlmC with PRC-barrel domain
METNFFSISTVIGTAVKNPEGEALGEIKDIVIDWEAGEVAYIVLSFGGLLGFGDKLFAMPLEAFSLNAREGVFLLDISKEKLAEAPGFDEDNWPNYPQKQFVEELHHYYGFTPYWDRKQLKEGESYRIPRDSSYGDENVNKSENKSYRSNWNWVDE